MKKVALLIYSSPFHFPPTINAANLLSEQGIEVHLLGLEHKDDWSQKLNEQVKLVYLGVQQTGLKGVVKYFETMFFIRRYLRKKGITSIIGYDAKSVIPAFFATRFRPVKWFFHQHDFWDKPKSLWERFIWKSERLLLKYADDTSFPQEERAEFFQKAASLNKKPEVVFNGPRKKWIEKVVMPDPVITRLREQFDYILIYQGGWSAFFGLERLFNALAICKTNTALVMLGEEREEGIRQRYANHISKLGLDKRVYLAEKYIPYEALAGFTKFADAAIAILTKETDPAPFNNRYLIGASNKITEYVACGLPVLIEDSSPNRRFMEKYNIGLLVNSDSAEEFAKVIDALLLDSDRRGKISEHNKHLFKDELNFDVQFGKIESKL